MFLGNADAGVFDGNEDFFIPDGGLDVNDRILVAEFDRVVDQVVENLLDFSEIGVDHLDAIRKGQVKRDAFRAARALEGCGGILDRPVDIEICPG